MDDKNPKHAPPWPVLDCARLLFYAILDDSVQYSGRTLLFVDGKELGQVPRLAICEEKKTSGVLLFHCDEEWNTLGCSGHPSVTEAKQRAEQIYGGISSKWVAARISEEAAEAYLSEMFGNERCSFCGRRPDQVNYVFGKDDEEAEDVRICDCCVNQFHEMLPK